MNKKKNDNGRNNGEINLMRVSYNDAKNVYSVDLAEGSSIAETAFAMCVVIKCLKRDGIIKETNEVTDLIHKYLEDPQYEEVKE